MPHTPAAIPKWRPRMAMQRWWVNLGEDGLHRITSRGVRKGTFVHVRRCSREGVRCSCLAVAVDGAIIITGVRLSLAEVEWTEMGS